jgi:uncharacterized protein YjbJ (UPF0337 family)
MPRGISFLQPNGDGLQVGARRHGSQVIDRAGQAAWHAACGWIDVPAQSPPARSNFSRSKEMNWDRIEGNWKQLKGKAKQQWGKLTDDQLDVIDGKRDQLAGKIQEEYGISKDETEKQLNDFERRYRDWDPRS